MKKSFAFDLQFPTEQAIACVVNKEFSVRTAWAFFARGEYRHLDDARKYSWGEFRSGLIHYAKQWEPEGRSDWGGFFLVSLL